MNNALIDGPQYVTRRGVDTVVVLSVQEYKTLTLHKPSFADFLLQYPTLDGEDPFARQHEYPRDLDL